MKRNRDGVDLIDRFACQLVSPQLAEEYGRLLRSYHLSNAVLFFPNRITNLLEFFSAFE